MQKDTVKELQENPNYVILDNPLASPKFVRMIGKGKEIAVNDIYTPKIFYDIASKLTPEHMIDVQRNQSIVLEINIKDFLEDIGANPKNYKHLIDSIETMQSSLLRWKEGDDIITTAIVTKSIHNPKTGKIQVFVDSDITKRILEVKEEGNFSFLKSNVFRLQNAQAIKLYPFFKSWLNHGRYATDIERFKIQFGYNTSGYKHWSNFEGKVLIPATEEINEKSDIHIHYEPTGDNLDGKRPRIKGLNFKIYKKDDLKILTEASPTPNQPHIDEAKPSLFDKENQVKELQELMNKIHIVEKPSDIIAKTLVESLLNGIGYQAIKDGLLGMIESNAKAKSIAFFTPENLLKYPGFEQAQNEAKEKKKNAREKEQELLSKKRAIEELRKIYGEEKKTYLEKVFKELPVDTQKQKIQELWDAPGLKIVYFRNNDIENPNPLAIMRIAQEFAFPAGYDEKKHLKHFAKTRFSLEIEFDDKGEVIVE